MGTVPAPVYFTFALHPTECSAPLAAHLRLLKSMATRYDCVVLGSGPGGYETAIRATQLGMKTAIIEKNKLGGVCLNVGCIPTKALLKSAEVMAESSHMSDFGIELEGSVTANFPKVIERSRGAATQMNKGVQYLMKKNDIDVIYGHGRLTAADTIEVEPSVNMDGEEVGEPTTVEGDHIIVATGARPREIPPLPIDGEKILSYKEAMLQREQPDRLVIVGAGAIGVEFGYFYHHMGTDVTIIEVQDRVVPNEDKDVSKELERAYKKMGMTLMTDARVQGVDTDSAPLQVEVETKTGTEHIECDQVLSAVGVVGNVEDIGLETVGVETDGGDIVVDDFYRTNVDGVYAIGDVTGAPWLAHKASHEGILCVEKIAGHDVRPIDLLPAANCLRRLHRGRGRRSGLRREGRQIPVQGQRQGRRARPPGGLREDDLRREVRRIPRLPHHRARRHGAHRRGRNLAQAGDDRARDYGVDAPAPDALRVNHGSDALCLWPADQHLI